MREEKAEKRGTIVCFVADDETLKIIEKLANELGTLSRSATIRLIIRQAARHGVGVE